MKLNDNLYRVLKWIVIIGLPASGALWTGLSKIWGLPYAAEIPATITVICTFLGAILCISTAEYYQGKTENAGKHEAQTTTPEISDPYEDLAKYEGGTATLDEIIADLKDLE